MIRRGKRDGWLSSKPQQSLAPWATANGCHFNGVATDNVSNKGLAILATFPTGDDAAPLISVPQDLVLSKDAVMLHAHADKHFRDVLEALGDFGKVIV